LAIIAEIIFSGQAQYERERERVNGAGIPIGNLTSQIFANIYLNELDGFVKHKLKTKHYLRYGDDFIILGDNLKKLKALKDEVGMFLFKEWRLELNRRNDIIIKMSRANSTS